MLLLDGNAASSAIKQVLESQVKNYKSEGKKPPCLAAILVGNNGASETYVGSKVRTCAEIGFDSKLLRFEASITEQFLINEIINLNNDEAVDGILVQLPLPDHINEANIINAIHPDKDVDGFHPVSIGHMVQGLETFIPATPYGIMLMLEYYELQTKGKHAVVIGRSNIVGRPMSILLSSNLSYGNCTVTLCHRYTENLKEKTLLADIIVAAVGIPGFITEDMIKEGAVVIDIGITRVEDSTTKKGYRLKGDVDFENVSKKAKAITPVPGGVGPMTIAALMKNTMDAYLRKLSTSPVIPLKHEGKN